MDYEKDVQIDLTNLDKEWERQPSLMQEYADELSELNREYARRLQVLKTTESKLRLDYRTGKEEVVREDGKPLKLTENAISELIDSDENINALVQEINEVKYNIDIVKSSVEALRAKKSALEWECQLYLSSYFGEPHDQKTLMKNKNKN